MIALMCRRSLLALVGTLLCGATLGSAQPDFERDIRPLLERSCYECHGVELQRGGLRLDVRRHAFRGGISDRAGIVPHLPEESELFRRVAGLSRTRVRVALLSWIAGQDPRNVLACYARRYGLSRLRSRSARLHR